MTDLVAKPIAELRSLLVERTITARALVEECLANIARHDGELKAFITVYGEDALAAADAADAHFDHGIVRGPLQGIPVAIKDNLNTAGRLTTMGARIHRDFVPATNAHVVDRLLGAGAIIVGKLNMHEYALGATTENATFGICRNPWDLDRSPGGSSGGSAVAVAAGMAVATLGTDTSGSIRIPSAYCGTVGFKGTYGRVSRRGCFPEAWTLDHIGPMGRTVADIAEIYDVISGHDPADDTSLPLPGTTLSRAGSADDTLAGVRIGVDQRLFFTGIDAQIETAVRSVLDRLAEQGAELRAIDVDSFRYSEWVLNVIDSSETATVHHGSIRQHPEDYSPEVRDFILSGNLPSAVDYLEAQQLRRAMAADLSRHFEEVDVLIGPAVPHQTPRIGQQDVDINGVATDVLASAVRLSAPASLLGLPVMALPAGLVNQMPVGLQVIGRALDERMVFRVGRAVERLDVLEGRRPAGLASQGAA